MTRTTTRPDTPAARRARRAPTLMGVAACANAPTVRETRRGYHTSAARVDRNAKVREYVRVDDLRTKPAAGK